MREQREALAQLLDAAGRAAQEEGPKFTLALQRRVQETVRSAAASEPEALVQGALEHELQSTGFEGLLGAAPAPRPPPGKSTRAGEAKQERKKAAEENRERLRLARALREAEREAQRLTAQAEALAHSAERAEARAAQVRKEADEARQAAEKAAAHARALRSDPSGASPHGTE